MDFDVCLKRHRARVADPWQPHQVDHGWAYQNRKVDPDAFERWFYEDTRVRGVPLTPEPIPTECRGVV